MNPLEQSVGIFTTDAQLTVRSWDTWLTNVTGLPASVVRGSKLFEIFPELETLTATFQNVLEQGVIQYLSPPTHPYLIPCTPTLFSKSFPYMQQHVTIAPLRDQDSIIGTIITIEDITLELEREHNLSNLREQLKSTSETTRLQAAQHLDSVTEEILFEALKDSSWRVRQLVVETLVQRSGPEVIAALVRKIRLEHQDMSILNSALQALTHIQGDVVTPLAELLHVPDVDLRGYAALALGEQPDRRAIPTLLEALNDPDTNVRYNAIEALGKLAAIEAVDLLMDIIESGDFFLAFPALDALKRISDPSITYRIIPLLQDEMLVEPALEVLGYIGDETIITPLVALLAEETTLTTAIVQALVNLYDRYQELYDAGDWIEKLAREAMTPAGVEHLLAALTTVPEEKLRGFALLLGWLEGEAIEHILIQLMTKPSARKEVIRALGRYGPQVIPGLLEQLKTEDVETRYAVVSALGLIGDKTAIPALVAILEHDENESLICATADAMTKIGESHTTYYIPLLKLLGHPSGTVRQTIVATLNALNPPELRTAVEYLLQDTNPLIRESAVRIIGYIGTSQINALLTCCKDEDENVRRAAIEMLPYSDSLQVVPSLIKALETDTPKVRAIAARALGSIDELNSLVVTFLRMALSDPDIWVRYFAVRSLGQRKARTAVDSLIHIIKTDEAIQVQIAAVEALGQIGDPQVIPLLVILKNSNENNLAKAALLALGQIQDPNVLQPLFNTLYVSDLDKRITAVQALGHYSGETVVTELSRVAKLEQEPSVVNEITTVFAQMKTPLAINALLNLSAYPKQREICIDKLAQLGENCIPAVATGLQHEQVNVRLATADVLARMQHPLATQELIKALGDEEASVRLVALKALGHAIPAEVKQRILEMASEDSNAAVRQAARKFVITQNTTPRFD